MDRDVNGDGDRGMVIDRGMEIRQRDEDEDSKMERDGDGHVIEGWRWRDEDGRMEMEGQRWKNGDRRMKMEEWR